MTAISQYAHQQNQTEKANFRHLVMDVFWFGLAFPALSRFIVVYALRVGASTQEIGWLSSMPSLILLFSISMSNWWRRRYPDATHAAVLPGLGFRLAFLLPAFTPLFPSQWQMMWLILSVSLPALPQGISTVMFQVMMREAVSVEKITALVSRRQVMMNITLGGSTFVLGLLLVRMPYPINYQVMFVLAFGLTLISLWHVKQTRPVFVMPPATRNLSARHIWGDSRFREVLIVVSIIHMAFFFAAPLVTIHLMKNMGADESFIALFTFSELMAGAGVSMILPRIASSVGHRALLAPATIGLAVSTLVIALSPNLWLTIPAAILNGAFWAAAGVGMFGYFSESTPPNQVASYTMNYNQAVFVSVFIAPLLSTNVIGERMDMVGLLLLGAVLRVIAGVVVHMGFRTPAHAEI